jgi:hypothetical protein
LTFEQFAELVKRAPTVQVDGDNNCVSGMMCFCLADSMLLLQVDQISTRLLTSIGIVLTAPA